MREAARFVSLGEAASVPIARGKHLFPYRTQQLSLSAVTILGAHPWENSTVPYYRRSLLTGGFFFFYVIITSTGFVSYRNIVLAALYGALRFVLPKAADNAQSCFTIRRRSGAQRVGWQTPLKYHPKILIIVHFIYSLLTNN
jgi:hypothetical protein